MSFGYPAAEHYEFPTDAAGVILDEIHYARDTNGFVDNLIALESFTRTHTPYVTLRRLVFWLKWQQLPWKIRWPAP